MKRLLLALSLLAATSANAADDWTATDKVMLGTAVAAISYDWAQTRTIARQPDRFHEAGNKFFLGSHPSVGRVNTYFVGYIAVTVGIAYVLPSEYRKLYLGGVILYETALVIHNNGIGIKASF